MIPTPSPAPTIGDHRPTPADTPLAADGKAAAEQFAQQRRREPAALGRL